LKLFSLLLVFSSSQLPYHVRSAHHIEKSIIDNVKKFLPGSKKERTKKNAKEKTTIFTIPQKERVNTEKLKRLGHRKILYASHVRFYRLSEMFRFVIILQTKSTNKIFRRSKRFNFSVNGWMDF
jgi:hypothetical protein